MHTFPLALDMQMLTDTSTYPYTFQVTQPTTQMGCTNPNPVSKCYPSTAPMTAGAVIPLGSLLQPIFPISVKFCTSNCKLLPPTALPSPIHNLPKQNLLTVIDIYEDTDHFH